ncbi:unnamed protein product, partial [Thlaspi arvense]
VKAFSSSMSSSRGDAKEGKLAEGKYILISRRLTVAAPLSPAKVVGLIEMGRLFVIELEGLVYKCRTCQTDIGFSSDIISGEDLGIHGKLFEFSRVFNTFLGGSTYPFMSDVLCVYCSASLGAYYVSAVEYIESRYRRCFIDRTEAMMRLRTWYILCSFWDRDEEKLVMFLEMRRLENGSGHCKSSTTTMSSQRYPLRRTAADNFLYSESEKSDYDWLVTPPGSPSKSQIDANPMALESQLEKCREEDRDNKSSRNQTIGLKRPSSSNSSRSTSRPSTPVTRSTTPTSRAARATLTSSSTSSSRPSTPARRPSTSGTSRTATSTAARAPLTSFSTSSARSTSRPCTPTRRPSSSGTSRANLATARTTTGTGTGTGTATSTRSNTRPMSSPSTRPGLRSSTPTRRPPTPTGSSTVLRSKPTKPAPSPTLRSRPWEPYEMPGFSLEAPSNLRTTLRDRPQTASSSRTKAFGASSSRSRSSSIESATERRQSCSPSRNRTAIGNANGPGPLLRGRRAKTSNNDGGLTLISHVAKGNHEMVERVVNVTENGGRGGGKSSSGSDGFGFGRDLSKSSFDMALRHMDIKRGSMTGNFRPQVTKVPAASLYSVRTSGTRRKRPVSRSGSSESSVNILCLDGSDDNLSDISC